MADILIRGMEMPRQGLRVVAIHSNGHVYADTSDPLFLHKIADVIELPEHGDLISKPALFDEVFRVWGVEYAESDCNTLMDLINDAPVIVPSNKEGTE